MDDHSSITHAHTHKRGLLHFVLFFFCYVRFCSCRWWGNFFLWFNSTITFPIRVLGISRAFLVKLLGLCTIYHSLTCVMFQTPVCRGYSWRQLLLCWAAIKDNIAYL